MVLIPTNLEADTDSVGPSPKRIHPAPHGGCISVKFAEVSADATLEIGTPVAWNETLEKYTAWDPNTGNSGETDEVQTLDVTGTVSGGTYTITFDGQTTAAIDFDAVEADVLAALEALSNIAPGDVVVADTVGALPMTITFGGAYADADVPLMEVDSSLLTGGGTYDIVETTPGTAGTAVAGVIAGFVFPNPIDLTDEGDVFGTVMFRGTIHRDDVALPVTGSPTATQLDNALQDGLIAKGLIVQGLAGIH
jgi:hypothetical protein